MSYTVTQLVTNSWYLSNIVSRGLETISGDQLYDGLNMLNEVLAIKTASSRMIPYYSVFDFDAVIGQELYFIPNLIECQTFTFFIGPVRYSMSYQGRKAYFGTPRVNGINTLPYQWHIERCVGGANLYTYFTPDQTYPLEITGKFSLASVSLNQDLSLTLDQFYIVYLRYALAEFMCQEYGIVFQPQGAQKLAELETTIVDISPPDLTITKLSTLRRSNAGDIYAQANLGQGWTAL